MTHSIRLTLAGAALVAAASLSAGTLSAQAAKAPAKEAAKAMKADAKDKAEHAMDHAAMGKGKADDHAASGWKELDAYHKLMMDTWHPAKGKNDLKPFKAKANDMAAAAKLLKASTPPKGCDAPGLRKAADELSPATSDAAVMVAKKAGDAELKAALGALLEKFEVLEKGCSAEAKAKHSH